MNNRGAVKLPDSLFARNLDKRRAVPWSSASARNAYKASAQRKSSLDPWRVFAFQLRSEILHPVLSISPMKADISLVHPQQET